MRVSDKAIVLQCIKRGDNKFILKLFTQQNGLITAAATVGKSPSSKIKSSHIMPLSLIDAEFILKQNKEIQQLTETSGYHSNPGISQALSKLSIAQFINELLIKCLKEQQPNSHLYIFIETCLKFLNDSEEDFVNLHLYFMMELTKYLGFEPQNNFSVQESFFDCRNGNYTSMSLAFPLGLGKEDSILFSEFLKINSLKTKLSNVQRRTLLDILLAYYRLHIPGFNEIRSLEVLKEVMKG